MGYFSAFFSHPPQYSFSFLSNKQFSTGAGRVLQLRGACLTFPTLPIVPASRPNVSMAAGGDAQRHVIGLGYLPSSGVISESLPKPCFSFRCLCLKVWEFSAPKSSLESESVLSLGLTYFISTTNVPFVFSVSV